PCTLLRSTIFPYTTLFRSAEREIWIKRDRLCIKLIGFLEIFQQRVRISLDLVRLKISQISVRVFGRFGFKARLFVWTERDASSSDRKSTRLNSSHLGISYA